MQERLCSPKQVNKQQRNYNYVYDKLFAPYRRCASAPRTAWHKLKIKMLLEAGGIDMEEQGTATDRRDDDNESLWTDHRSWVVLMGGFVFDLSRAERPILPDQRKTVTLTDEGVLMMCEHWPRLLPRSTSGEIKDKSKSDTLGKVLTCWQATWFCLQCIFRLSSSLPVTLLELSVFAHAICALLIFATWWDKPKDVQRPHIYSSDEYASIAAVLLNVDRQGLASRTFVWTSTPPCNLELSMNDDTNIGNMFNRRHHVSRCVPSAQPEELAREISAADIPIALTTDDIVSPVSLILGGQKWTFKLRYPYSFISHMDRPVDLHVDSNTINRLKAIRHHEQLHAIIESVVQIHVRDDASETERWHERFPRFICSRSHNWSINTRAFDLNETEERLSSSLSVYIVLSLLGAAIANALYGGLHAIAWDVLLPSATETLLWRTSSGTVASFGAVALATYLFKYFPREIRHQISQRLYSIPRSQFIFNLERYVDKLGLFILVPATVLWYILCRVFLVVECFRSLAYLSESMLSNPSWSMYIPHIS